MSPLLRDSLAGWLGPELGTVLTPSWFSLVAIGWLVGTWLAARLAREHGLPLREVLRALLAGYVAALLCGIVGPVAVDALEQAARGEAVRWRWAGMTSWFGIAGAFAGMGWALRGSDIGFARFLDCLALPAGIALCIARFGCFFAGCDFGKVSSVPWALRFPAHSSAWRAHLEAGWIPRSATWSLPVHPTQLYEAALGLGIAMAVALAMHRQRLQGRDWAPGRLFAFASALYLVGRLPIESLRGDIGRGIYAGLSTGHWLCLALLAALPIGFLARRHFGRTLAPVALVACVVAALPTRAAAEEGRPFSVSAMLGTSAALNRPDGQVPALSGWTLAGSYRLSDAAPQLELSVAGELESLANSVAAHRSLIVSGELQRHVNSDLSFGVRVGAGFTSVDFLDPAFDTVLATDLRASAILHYWATDDWGVSFWPLTFDAIHDRELGGSVLSFQMRLGVSWGPRGKAAAVNAAPLPAPTPPPVSGPPGDYSSSSSR